MKIQIQIYITIEFRVIFYAFVRVWGAELGQVRVWSGAQDIRIYINIGHYYTKSFARRFQNGLRGGRAGYPPWLFVAG